jgi:hypothetical protein
MSILTIVLFDFSTYGLFCICFLRGEKHFGSAFSRSLNRLLGTILGCLGGYVPLSVFGTTPQTVVLVNGLVLFIFVFMRSSDNPAESYIGGTAAWILPLVTMSANNNNNAVDINSVWQRIMESFVAVLVVLFFDYIVFGKRAETLLRLKLARSMRVSNRIITKVVKHYTDPCGRCQARAGLECEPDFRELLALGTEQRQLVNFAAIEPHLWHPKFSTEGFATLCDTVEEVRLHAISLRRALELSSWSSTVPECVDHAATFHQNPLLSNPPASGPVSALPAPDLVKELGAPLLQSVSYLSSSFKSLASAVTAPRLELPDDMAEVNEKLPELFDSCNFKFFRVSIVIYACLLTMLCNTDLHLFRRLRYPCAARPSWRAPDHQQQLGHAHHRRFG